MCGIAGIVALGGRDAPVSGPVVDSMVDAVAHRGPDGRGLLVGDWYALGHARLAIIDPTGGAQPFVVADGSVAVTYNGEIYNHAELRRQLESHGHRFSTRSDTEVLARAYLQWGPACVERLRGMFAFAVVDDRDGTVTLARDHLGIKPLHHAWIDGSLVFASELGAFSRVPGFDPTPDPAALDDYLALAYIPAPRTAYRSVAALEPGTVLTARRGGGPVAPRRYWSPRPAEPVHRHPDDLVDELEAALVESVTAHLVADVPFGAFLSGGIDSSLVASIMTDLLGEPVRTFTIGYDDPAHDEAGPAALVAGVLGTDHHEVRLGPDTVDVFDLTRRLVAHHGQPFGDSSAIPTWLVSELARAHVPMVLSGDGADELFGGYDRYRHHLDRVRFADLPAWRRPVHRLRRGLDPATYRARRPGPAGWTVAVERLGPDARSTLWRPEVRPEVPDVPRALAAAGAGLPVADPTVFGRFVDAATYLPGDVLAKVDVASMAHGLEVRTPFCDVRIAELAATVDPRSLLDRRSPEPVGKLPLRALAARRLPQVVSRRPKHGFSVPVGSWLGPGPAAVELAERLDPVTSPLGDFFEPTAVADLLARARHDRRWQLLVLDEWLRTLVPAPSSP